MVGPDKGRDLLDEGILLSRRKIALGDIARVEDGLGREQLEQFHLRGFFRGGGEGVGGQAGIQMGREALEQRDLGQRLLVAGFGFFLGLVDALGDGVEVGEDEFGGDDLDVAHRVDGAHGVDDIAILEAAHDVDDGVDFADVG